MRYLPVYIIAMSSYAILSGCVTDIDEPEITTFATDQEVVNEYGLTLKPSENMYVTPDVISEIYLDTMSCMGMFATGPTIEFRSFSFAGLGGAWAFYHPAASTIWINTDENDMRDRDARTDKEALQHEFVHHILHMNDAGEESQKHASPLLEQCGAGVNTYN